MSDEKEMNPTQSEKEKVSSNTAGEGVETPGPVPLQETPASQEASASTVLVKCKTCGKETPRRGKNTKFCDACSAGRVKVTRQQRAAGKKASSYVYDSATEPTKSEIQDLLKARGISNPQVLKTLQKWGAQAAQFLGVVPNRFFWANGTMATKASYRKEAAQPLEVIAADPVTGELLNRAELFALYDFCVAPHEDTTFDEYLTIRQNCKRDCFYLGKEILQKDFEDVHFEWSKWLPKFDPTTLPPNYTQRQAIEWLKAQAPDIKEFLMIASRSSFKSSFSHIWILTAILCLPDVRILLVSETRPLSKDFIGVIRSYFEVQEGFETRFQRLFAEYTIPMGDGSVLSLECPMARLRLAQSIESTSMDSTVAGKRSDLIIFDDPISNQTVGNETQIQASVNKRDALVKLGEAGARIILTIGTPWAANDLYAQLIERNASVEEPFMAWRIDPAFTVKKYAQHKLTVTNLHTLVESDIESYLFSRFTWKGMRSEMTSPAFFLSQNLCIFPKGNEEGLRVTFTEDDLRNHLRREGFFREPPGTLTVCSLDRAYSTAMYSDFSVVNVSKIMQVAANENVKPKMSLVVWDVFMDRVKESELVKAIVDMFAKHHPTYFTSEKDKGYENLDLAIRKACLLRSIPVPTMRWVPTSIGAKTDLQKARRIKKLELPLASDILWFRQSTWDFDAVVAQFTKMDGGIFVSANSHRKLDAPDAISLAWEQYMPRSLQEQEPEDPKVAEQRKEQQEEDYQRAARQAFHDRMHGGSGTRRHPQASPPPVAVSQWVKGQRGEPQFPSPEPQQPQSAHPRHFPRGGGFATLPGNMRGNPNKR